MKQLLIIGEKENNVFRIIRNLYTFDDSTNDHKRFNREMEPLYEARAALHRLTITEEGEALEVYSKRIQNTDKMDLELSRNEVKTIISVLGMADYISVSLDEKQAKPQPFFKSEKLKEIRIIQEKIEHQRRETFVDESPF